MIRNTYCSKVISLQGATAVYWVASFSWPSISSIAFLSKPIRLFQLGIFVWHRRMSSALLQFERQVLALPVCLPYVEPAVNRQPGFRWGTRRALAQLMDKS